MEEKLKGLIKSAVKIEDIDPKIEFPSDSKNGDFSTSVAMVLAKREGEKPLDLAQKIASEIEKIKPEYISKVEAVQPGFINFFLSKEYFSSEIKNVLEQDKNYGKSELYKGKKILVEHSSPNLFKPFHIGHVMNNTIGEAISRLAKFSGATVTTISYPSDVSLGIGKALLVLMEDGKDKLDSFLSDREKLTYLGECYVRGTKLYDEDEKVVEKVKEITKVLYEKTSGEILDLYNKCKEINLSHFKSVTKRLGSNFEDFIFESEAGEAGERIVRENIGRVFEESEGAVIFRGEDRGLHTRVFINKEGFPTYEAKDIGLLFLKFERFSPDLSILITDNQQAPYYSVVLEAGSEINKGWKEKTVHRTHGRMSFKGQKMSSRLGGVPLATDVLNEILEEVLEKSPDLIIDGEVNLNSIPEKVAIASLKFSILKSMAGKDINFDPETSLSFEGDSGPYLQYTAVRANSVLIKAKEAGLESEVIETNSETSDLEKMVSRFPKVVSIAIEEWAPHHVSTYLLNLSQAFNSWYASTKILDLENKEAKHNLALTLATKIVLTNGLNILGIEVPEKM
ncbi:MAG: arginine--tRNA ligase [Candidatus Pacebacteria bacterium]|nr:arginine--tRNA ligase [Candidatus Paceibacterota bacterium]